jgi:hypothetical protein
MKPDTTSNLFAASTPLWPWLVVLACTGVGVAGALALIGYIALAMIGY